MLQDLIQNIPGWKKQSARTWEGPCPRCGGSKRCIAWIHQDIFKCRECDYKGDLITWLRDQEGLSCKDAHHRAGRDCHNSACPAWDKCRGIVTDLPRHNTSQTAIVPQPRAIVAAPTTAPDQPQALWQQHAAKLADWAHDQLLANHDQLAYLESRGLDYGAVIRYRLGWIPADLYRPRAAWGLPAELRDNGQPKKLWIPVGITIPMYNGDQVHRIRIRRPVVQGGETRYYWLPGSGNDTFTLDRGHFAAVVVESDLDALLLDHLAGDIVNTVSLGTCSARPKGHTADMLKACPAILVALDSDQAGAAAFRWWRENYPQAERWPVIGGKDPGEAYQNSVDLRAWILAGLPVSLHPADIPSEKRGISTATGGGVESEEAVQGSTFKVQGSNIEQPLTLNVEPPVRVITSQDGRTVHITDDPEQYNAIVARGGIVFSSRELALVETSGATKEEAGRFLDVKQAFPGARMVEPVIPTPPAQPKQYKGKFYHAK